MNRKVFFFIAALVICSSISAQEQHYPVNPHAFGNNMNFKGRILINGIEQQSNDIEIGAFNGNTITGSKRIECFGTNQYYRINMLIYGTNENYEVSFKLYNHQTGEELDNCIITTAEGEPCTVIWENDGSYGTFKNSINLNFVSGQAFTKDIAAYTENGGYYLIASPIGEVDPENVENMLANSYDLYWFDQSQELEWRNYKKDGGFNLVSGKGYLYANSADITLSFTGAPYSGNGEVTLAYDEKAGFTGWNLVGNPFAETAYIADGRDFYVMNEEGSEIVPAESNNIAAMEGVFVLANADGETMTFTTTEPESGNGKGLALNLSKGASTGSATRDGVIDRAIIRIGEGAMLPKFQFRDNSTKIYIPQDGKDYAIATVGRGAERYITTEVPVHFKTKENGSYSINVDAKDIGMSYLHLIDNMTGADIDLLESSCYTFEAKTSDYAARFKLVFATLDSPTNGNNFAFIDANGNIIVNGEGTLQVVDVTGRVILSGDAMNRVSTNGMTAGVYVLRLINGNDVKTQKIVVR